MEWQSWLCWNCTVCMFSMQKWVVLLLQLFLLSCSNISGFISQWHQRKFCSCVAKVDKNGFILQFQQSLFAGMTDFRDWVWHLLLQVHTVWCDGVACKWNTVNPLAIAASKKLLHVEIAWHALWTAELKSTAILTTLPLLHDWNCFKKDQEGADQEQSPPCLCWHKTASTCALSLHTSETELGKFIKISACSQVDWQNNVFLQC